MQPPTQVLPGTDIPCQVFQIWQWKPGDTTIPKRLLQLRATWQTINPNVPVRLVTRQVFEDAILPTYPAFSALYWKLHHWVQRADYARLILMYHFGGVYADMDTQAIVPLRQWVTKYPDLASKSLIFARDTMRTTAIRGCLIPHKDHGIAVHNWCFATTPKHPVLKAILERVNTRVPRASPPEPHAAFILSTTGPKWLSETLCRLTHEFEFGQHGVHISSLPLFGDTRMPTAQSHPGFQGFLVQHKFSGSWRSDPVKAAATPPSQPHSETKGVTPQNPAGPSKRNPLELFHEIAPVTVSKRQKAVQTWASIGSGLAAGTFVLFIGLHAWK